MRVHGPSGSRMGRGVRIETGEETSKRLSQKPCLEVYLDANTDVLGALNSSCGGLFF